MTENNNQSYLIKFLVISAFSLFIGAVHGMLQVWPPVRHWLDSIGSPYGGPGHMIDPLAHAHMNLVGGVVMMTMAVTYYLLPILSGRPIHSIKLINQSFWWMFGGVYSFYFIQMIFGAWEGELMLHHDIVGQNQTHHWYGPIVALSGTSMAIAFLLYCYNIYRSVPKCQSSSCAQSKKNKKL